MRTVARLSQQIQVRPATATKRRKKKTKKNGCFITTQFPGIFNSKSLKHKVEMTTTMTMVTILGVPRIVRPPSKNGALLSSSSNNNNNKGEIQDDRVVNNGQPYFTKNAISLHPKEKLTKTNVCI